MMYKFNFLTYNSSIFPTYSEGVSLAIVKFTAMVSNTFTSNSLKQFSIINVLKVGTKSVTCSSILLTLKTKMQVFLLK